VIINDKPGIQSDELAVMRQGQRVHFYQLRVKRSIRTRDPVGDRQDTLDDRRFYAGETALAPEGDRGNRAVRPQRDPKRARRLLDLHAALGPEQQRRTAELAIENDREVQFVSRIDRGLHPCMARAQAFDRNGRDLRERGRGLCGSRRPLDRPGLAPSAYRQLRLDDDIAAVTFCGVCRMLAA